MRTIIINISIFQFSQDNNESPCLITDLLQHEDKNGNDVLNYSEFQAAFSHLFTITMVTLDQNLAVNNIQAHVGDNVEIRCDIVGRPTPPPIVWTRWGVNLATINVPNLKVFSDGSLYLTDVQLSLSGNYTCQAEGSNSAIKQVHILSIIVPPVVEVNPKFQWSPLNGVATIDCRFENVLDSRSSIIEWLKNDEVITPSFRTTLSHNSTRLTISDLVRSDTGAYACRVRNHEDTAMSQDISSLLVQNDPISSTIQTDDSKLWVFHGNGVTIYRKGCGGLLHEIDGRDVIPLNGQPLCGNSRLCEWGPSPLFLDGRVYISQPPLSRIIVLSVEGLNVIQLIATDPYPKEMWLIRTASEARIWLLCHGEPLPLDVDDDQSSSLEEITEKKKFDILRSSSPSVSYKDMLEDPGFIWNSPSRDQRRHNRKTIQVIRISDDLSKGEHVIHLQPIDGHFDLVYQLFVPSPSPLQSQHFFSNSRFAYATHWDERTVVKIDMDNFKYVKMVNLAECQPIDAAFTDYGLVIIQCQTPITHQLNGQLILDEVTDAIVSFSPHIKGDRSFISPNQEFVVNIFSNESATGHEMTTIIVQEVSKDGVFFLYDVRTTLPIVNCDFVWKSGNYDAVLASGSSGGREDLLYLSLSDGRVELISGIGRPTGGTHRGMAVSQKDHLGAVTSLESVFVVDFNVNRVQCESPNRHQNPGTLLWT